MWVVLRPFLQLRVNRYKNEWFKRKWCGINLKKSGGESKTENQSDESYKVCPNCGKTIRRERVICPNCGIDLPELRGGLQHPILSNKNAYRINDTTIHKRPLSIGLIVFLGVIFLIALIIWSVFHLDLAAIIILFPIFIIITFSLIFVNLRKNKTRTFGFLISTCVLIIILIILSVGFSNMQSKKVVLAPKKNDILTNNVTNSYTATTTATTIAATTATTIAATVIEAPTIKLAIYEGPAYSSGNDVCYYRVKAVVTGKPTPTVVFSKDDSNRAWGTLRAQVNLTKIAPSYTLTVTVKNSAGQASDSITLNWVEPTTTG